MLDTELNPSSDLWLSDVEAPQIITDPNLFKWDDQADLVIAGLGGAGIAAANEALDQGLSVIGIDKTTGGGSTAKSGGVYYAGGGTPIQKEAGIDDSPENMFNYLIQETGDIIKESTLKKFCETSAENTQWLMDNGVKFNSSYYKKKSSYPDAGYFLTTQIILWFPVIWKMQLRQLAGTGAGRKDPLDLSALVEQFSIP
tara:strand:- start:20 stop:616 length:597 start_codon:yes stop_codon:yes gene_type:complete